MPKHAIRGHFNQNGKKMYYSSQQDLADGWRKVLPQRNMVEVELKDQKEVDGNLKKKKENKIMYNEVNLTEFPPHLYKKLNSKKEIYYDNFFKFKLLKTEHDDAIMTLYKKLQKKFPNEKEKLEIKELGELLESNNLSGWITIRASQI